jgi:gliding motility-associated-like protein
MRYLIKTFAALLFSLSLQAQVTGISGVVNSYCAVTGIDKCANLLQLSSVSGFAAGDRVMLIQMKGADVALANNSTFGSITSYNNSGNFEFNTIDSIIGTQVKLRFLLTRNYDIQGKVQLIRVASYATASVIDTVTCPAWNGSTGGVIVIEADSVRLNSMITADGKGFRGGNTVNSGSSCTFGGYNGYFTGLASLTGGQKGEGICEYSTGYEAARGRLANGGGGGNDHNSGGGGGSNGSFGGQGGERIKNIFSCPGPYPGKGGDSLDYSGNRLFMGGGGGGGHGNNMLAGKGGNGGGIVIIKAYSLKRVAGGITVNGKDGGLGSQDGAGGGGAGGTILLFLDSLSDLSLGFRGGNGGHNDNDQVSDCCGPGGGGSDGRLFCRYLKISNPLIISNNFGGGSAGSTINTQSPCFGSSNGATAGGNATSPGLFPSHAINLPEDSIPYQTSNFATINTGNDTTICAGDSIQLQASGGLIYSWSPAAGLSDTAIANPWAKPSSATKYVVEVSISAFCRDTASVMIQVMNRPLASAGTDTALCPGDSVQLQSSGGTDYSWLPAAGLNNPQLPDPKASPANTTDYIVTVSNGSCISTDTVKVTVRPAVNAVAGHDLQICAGDSAQLNAAGGIYYQWSPVTGLSNPSIANPKAGPASATEYVVTVSNAFCSGNDTVKVSLTTKPVSVAGADDTICKGETAILTASGTGSGRKWSTGELTQSIQVTPVITTTYLLEEANGTCKGNTDSVTVFVYQPAIAAFAADPPAGGAPLKVDFTNQSTQALSYSWHFGDNSPVSSATDPSHVFSAGGIYTVLLIAYGDGNCNDSVSVQILVSDTFRLHIPNVFTPNNDGFNDLFEISHSGIKEMHGSIHNRWGQLMYEWGPGSGNWWNGYVENKEAGEGIYYYLITVTDLKGEERVFHGSVSLLR